MGRKYQISAYHLKALKEKNNIRLMYLKRLKTTFNLGIRYIELKKQDAKNELFASRLKSK